MNIISRSQKKGLQDTLYYLKRLLHYFHPYRRRILISIIFMGIYALSTSAMALLVKPLLDNIFINKNQDALMLIPLLIVLVFVIRGSSLIIQNYQIQYCTLRGMEDIRNDLYNKVIRLPVGFFEHNQVGMLITRIINDVEQIHLSIPQIIRLIRHVLTVLVLVAAAFYRDTYLAAWAVVILPLILFPLIYLGKKLREFGRKRQNKIAELASLLQEKFNAIQVIKSFATEDKEHRNFVQQNASLRDIAFQGRFFNALSTPSMQFILGISCALVVLYGGGQVIAGNSTPGNFFSFLTAISLLFKPMQNLSNSNLKIQQALVGAERVFGILDSREIQQEQGGDLSLQKPFQGLYFENVSFYYPDFSKPALRDIDLEIIPGEKLAIVGPSGSGKSTLVNLIPRFFAPDRGRIVLNNRELSEYDLASLRRYIGIITQDGILFNSSIRENLTYGITDADDERLQEVCRSAYIHDFIMGLPHGYDTVIGEQGEMLSGGQKQRLIISRTLLKDPELLILDEATSALDRYSEQNLQQALNSLMLEKTSIVIAHRLSTIISADRIVVLDNGTISDIGTHHQLLERCGLYRELYDLEFQD